MAPAKQNITIPVSPLSLDPLTRDYWGSFDAAAIAQLAELAADDCYQLKFYKAPSIAEENMAVNAYVAYGLKITSGSLIFGIYNPVFAGDNTTLTYDLQITDQQLNHQFWSEPVPSALISNFKPTFASDGPVNCGSFPYLFNAPYPVVGEGLFLVEIWNTSGAIQRTQVVLGVLENVG